MSKARASLATRDFAKFAYAKHLRTILRLPSHATRARLGRGEAPHGIGFAHFRRSSKIRKFITNSLKMMIKRFAESNALKNFLKKFVDTLAHALTMWYNYGAWSNRRSIVAPCCEGLLKRKVNRVALLRAEEHQRRDGKISTCVDSVLKVGGLGIVPSLINRKDKPKRSTRIFSRRPDRDPDGSMKGKRTMKKLMIVATAALCAAVGFSDIESSNVVGYQSLDWMKADYYMMGTQFENVNGTDIKLEEIDFGDIASTAPCFDYNGDYKKTAVQVQIANADREGAQTYYFLADGNWDDVKGEGTPAWVDAEGFYANPTVAAGIGYWFRNQLSAKPQVQTAGQVLPDSPWEKTFDTNYRFLVNPFPVEWTLESVDFGEIEKDAPCFDYDGNYKKTATQIQVPNATTEGFQTYYFLADGNWDDVKGEGTPAWVDAEGFYANPTVPAGRGCWFRPLPTGSGLTVNFYIDGKPAK